MLQRSEWEWSSGEAVTYITWANQYQFPTSYHLLHNNQPISKTNILPTTLTLNAYKEDGMCTAAIRAPDFTGAWLFPVDCTKNFTSRYACLPPPGPPIPTLPPPPPGLKPQRNISLNASDLGFQVEKRENRSVLQMQGHICPQGYDILYKSTCLKLVNFPAYVYDYTGCACSTSCRIADVVARNVYLTFNNICTNIDNASSVYSMNVKLDSDEATLIESYLLQILPPASTTLLLNIFDLKYWDYKTSYCEMIPALNIWTGDGQIRSYIKNIMYNPHFVLCARSILDISAAEAPRWFQNFKCNDGSFIGEMLQCDGIPNCLDAEDEDNCSHVCALQSSECFSRCVFPTCRCSDYYYQCISGGCITFDKFCNGRHDCPLEEDEQGCEITTKTISITPTLQDIDPITGFCYGGLDYLPCSSRTQCYSLQRLCQYDTMDGILMHCADGRHLGAFCQHHVCSYGYKCFLSYCIPTRKVCDGNVDCPNGDDEELCDNMACPGHLRCSNTTFCVPPHELCDGDPQCPFGEDEKMCVHCLDECVCSGNVMSCDNVNVSSVELMTPPVILILNDSYSLFHSIQELSPHFFKEMLHLRFYYGKFGEYLQNKNSSLQYCKSLRWLQISHQGIAKHNTNFIHGPLVTHLDLSLNFIIVIEHQAFDMLRNVQFLNLKNNKLSTLQAHFFDALVLLRFLHLQNNPLYDIASGIFANNLNLLVLRSDWYMICCIVNDVENCQPKSELVSSCTSLLSFTVHKVFIMLQAVITTLANGAVLLRFFITIEASSDRPLMFSLVFADLMMGVYLFVLTIMDLYTHGNFHEYAAQWTNSYTCLVAGIFNFVSSEASLSILVGLSLVRAVGIRKVGGLWKMKKTVIGATACAWGFTVVLTSLYVVTYELGNFKLRNNMCIILGISHQRHVSAYEQIFQVIVLVVNTLLLIALCVCAFAMFRTVYRSHKHITDLVGKSSSKAQQRITKIGGRLVLLLFFNLLCWIPILCIAGILLFKIKFNGDVLSWIAALFIPISATTDPFLYNINVIKKLVSKK